MYKAVFISDVHLGTDICQYKKLLAFLKSLETPDGYDVQKLYLVGDIIDMVQINHKMFWGKHRTVIKKLLRMADKGVEILYIPGNHDYMIRDEVLSDPEAREDLNGVSFAMNFVHESADGKKYLVLHGDEFDGAVKAHPVLYKLGDWAYSLLICISKWQNRFRRLFGMREWSLSLWVKTKTKNAIQFINRFEELVVREASNNEVDGVIAGHIHKAEDTMFDDIRYLNCGCWTEFCSAIFENEDGTMEMKYITVEDDVVTLTSEKP